MFSFFDYHEVLYDENLSELVLAKELATHDVVTVSIEDNLSTALEEISRGDYSLLPVVAPDNPLHMLGVLTRRDIMEAYDQAVLKESIKK